MKVLGIILILAGLVLGYFGFNKLSESTESVEIIGINIEASDTSGKQQGYVFLGLAIVLFASGVYTLNKKAI